MGLNIPYFNVMSQIGVPCLVILCSQLNKDPKNITK